MGGSATLTGMYGVIYFTGQRIAAKQMATIAKQEQAQVQACCAHSHVPSGMGVCTYHMRILSALGKPCRREAAATTALIVAVHSRLVLHVHPGDAFSLLTGDGKWCLLGRATRRPALSRTLTQ